MIAVVGFKSETCAVAVRPVRYQLPQDKGAMDSLAAWQRTTGSIPPGTTGSRRHENTISLLPVIGFNMMLHKRRMSCLELQISRVAAVLANSNFHMEHKHNRPRTIYKRVGSPWQASGVSPHWPPQAACPLTSTREGVPFRQVD